jgi:hypothetical protein
VKGRPRGALAYRGLRLLPPPLCQSRSSPSEPTLSEPGPSHFGLRPPSLYPWSSNFREPRTGEVQHSPGPEGSVPPPEATEKPDRSGRGKDSEGTRLDDKSDCRSGRIRTHTPNGVSLYARWPLSRVLKRGKVQTPLQEDGGRARPRDSESPAGTEGEAPTGLWTI